MKKSRKRLIGSIGTIVVVSAISIPTYVLLSKDNKNSTTESKMIPLSDFMSQLPHQKIQPPQTMAGGNLKYDPVEFDKIRKSRSTFIKAKDASGNVNYKIASGIKITFTKKAIDLLSYQTKDMDEIVTHVAKYLNTTILRNLIPAVIKISPKWNVPWGTYGPINTEVAINAPFKPQVQFSLHWYRTLQHEWGHLETMNSWNVFATKAYVPGVLDDLKIKKIQQELQKINSKYHFGKNIKNTDSTNWKNITPWHNIKNLKILSNLKETKFHSEGVLSSAYAKDALTTEFLTRTPATITTPLSMSLQDYLIKLSSGIDDVGHNYPLFSPTDNQSNAKIMDIWFKYAYGMNNKHGILQTSKGISFESLALDNTKDLKEIKVYDSSNTLIKTIPIHHSREIFGFNQAPLAQDFDHKYVYDAAWAQAALNSVQKNLKFKLIDKNNHIVDPNTVLVSTKL